MLLMKARQPLVGNPDEAQRTLYRRLVNAFIDSRWTAAELAFARTSGELQLYLPQGYTRIVREVPAELDAWRARRAARGYVERWRQSVDDAIRVERGSRGGIYRTAAKQSEPMLRVAARTEASQSFTYARNTVLSGIQTDALFKVWDSILDAKRTCRICANAHGTVVRLHEDFPQGLPGGVHPNCLCSEQILPAWLVDSDDLELAAAAA